MKIQCLNLSKGCPMLVPNSLLFFYFLLRHMKEISELQAFQRNEIESLYRELGKTLPPSVGLLHAAPPTGRRRRASKHKLKAGKLLNPMVQHLRNNLNTSSERKGTRRRGAALERLA